MTREEVKPNEWDFFNGVEEFIEAKKVDIIIDKIFDHFESQMKQNNKLVSMMNKEMQEIKSRSCSDCENCMIDFNWCKRLDISVDSDFCCNYWEG